MNKDVHIGWASFAPSHAIEKTAQGKGGTSAWSAFTGGLKNIGGMVSGLTHAGVEAGKAIPSSLLYLGALGAGAGYLGTAAYDALESNVSHEDAEEKLNRDIEAIYSGKAREMDDAKWMSDVRADRDELQRNWKKMTPEEYEKAYARLMSKLEEKKGED